MRDLVDHPRQGVDRTRLGVARRATWARRRWRRLYDRIDRRVGIEGDSDTRRFQKVLVVLASLIGSVATVFNALTLFRGGLVSSGWAYVLSAIVLLVGGFALLLRPHRYVVITWVLLLDVLVLSSAAQILSGGMTSGLYALPWSVFAPLGAALALGSRHTAAHLVLFVVTIGVVAAIDPWARTLGPDVSSSALLSFNIPSLLSLGAMAGATSLYLLRQLEIFRARADSLLLNVLPDSIAGRLKRSETTIADRFEAVTVLFADIVGFTPLASGLDAEYIVDMLNSVFSDFDDLARENGVLKIKTIGDSYMAAAGLPEPREHHTAAVLDFALTMRQLVQAREGLDGRSIRLRIGVNTGPVVAGVIGHDRFIYDLWGDTVNVASRMESAGLTDEIQVSEAVVQAVGDDYVFEPRDPIEIKGKGVTRTYLLKGKAATSSSRE